MKCPNQGWSPFLSSLAWTVFIVAVWLAITIIFIIATVSWKASYRKSQSIRNEKCYLRFRENRTDVQWQFGGGGQSVIQCTLPDRCVSSFMSVCDGCGCDPNAFISCSCWYYASTPPENGSLVGLNLGVGDRGELGPALAGIIGASLVLFVVTWCAIHFVWSFVEKWKVNRPTYIPPDATRLP